MIMVYPLLYHCVRAIRFDIVNLLLPPLFSSSWWGISVVILISIIILSECA